VRKLIPPPAPVAHTGPMRRVRAAWVGMQRRAAEAEALRASSLAAWAVLGMTRLAVAAKTEDRCAAPRPILVRLVCFGTLSELAFGIDDRLPLWSLDTCTHTHAHRTITPFHPTFSYPSSPSLQLGSRAPLR
jgi:hypothetical protein